MSCKMYNAAIYCRLSKEDGNKLESNSISSQKAYCEDYIAKQEDIRITQEPFVDDGISGVSLEREGFKALEKEIIAGRIDCVVVKDLSRFSRNYLDSGRYVEKIFPKLGVRFIAINDHYDSLTSDPNFSGFALPFKNLINDSYSQDISVKIRSSLEIKKKNGAFVGNYCPYGYKRHENLRHKLIVDENVRGNIRNIFYLFKEGVSIGKIAEKLNELEVLSPMDYKRASGVHFETSFKTYNKAKWEYNTVKRILTNEVYTGVLSQGKRGTVNYKVKVVQNKHENEWIRIEDSHEPIISREDFIVVNQMLKRDMRTSIDKKENVLSGFLFCADCGATMVKTTTVRNGKKYTYYVCSNHKKNKNCSTHSISSKIVEEKIYHAIYTQIELIMDLEETLILIEKLPNKEERIMESDHQIKLLESEVDNYKKLKLRLYEDFVDEVISIIEYQEFHQIYSQRLEAKKIILKKLNKEASKEEIIGDSKKNWVTRFKSNKNIESLNRRIVMSFIHEVKLHEKGGIEIVFKYSDEFQTALSCLLKNKDKIA